ncbi:MAG: cell wall hydrolase [Lachnospiraceae bacterium]|nr:cell wall hydrolase [Lachnospiraceae bacterium]
MNTNIKEGIRIALKKLARGVTGVVALVVAAAVIISCTLSISRQELVNAEASDSLMFADAGSAGNGETGLFVIRDLLADDSSKISSVNMDAGADRAEAELNPGLHIEEDILKNEQISEELIKSCFNIAKESGDTRKKALELETNIIKVYEKDVMDDTSAVVLSLANPENPADYNTEALPGGEDALMSAVNAEAGDTNATKVEPSKNGISAADKLTVQNTELNAGDNEPAVTEAEKLEAEKKEAEKLEAEKKEAERIEAEKKEAERLEAEKKEAERIEAEKKEAEKKEAEKSKTTGIDRPEKNPDKDYKHSDDLVYNYNKKMDIDITDEEYEVLCRIVEAEAGDQDVYGRILVANVILNRVRYKKEFANDIIGVVFEKNQFAPTRDGSYYSVKVSKKTKEAVNRATSGEDYSQGALYFFMRSATSKSKASWFDTLDYLFKYGCHEFFK